VVSQPLDWKGRRRLQTRVAGAPLSGAEAEIREARQALAYEVQTAYLELLLARELVALNESLATTATQFSEAAQKRFDVGDVPRVEVDRASLEAARADKELLKSRSEARIREAELDEFLGRDATSPTALADKLEFRPIETKEKELIVQALEQRPEIRAAQAELRARESEVRLAGADRLPDLSVQGKRNSVRSDGRNAVMLVLSVPLFDQGALRGEASALTSDAAEQAALCRELERRIRLQVVTPLAHVQQARASVERYERELVPQTEQVTQTIQRGFDAGASTMLDVLEAQRTLRSVQTEYRQAIADYLKAVVELNHATGATRSEGE